MGTQQRQGASPAGVGGIISMVTSNPRILQAITGMLGNDRQHGGLGGLVARFEQAGLGNVIGLWIGSGQNQPVSGEQLAQVLGSNTVGAMAQKLGLSTDDFSGQLSQILPGLIDHLTPQGQAPAGGLGSAGDLMGVLGGLLRQPGAEQVTGARGAYLSGASLTGRCATRGLHCNAGQARLLDPGRALGAWFRYLSRAPGGAGRA